MVLVLICVMLVFELIDWQFSWLLVFLVQVVDYLVSIGQMKLELVLVMLVVWVVMFIIEVVVIMVMWDLVEVNMVVF